MTLEKVIRLRFEIEVLTGLQIRGAGGELEIGSAVDPNLAIIRNPANNEPYIPGSSLKGKLRSSLERLKGIDEKGEPCGCEDLNCMVCVVFGAHKRPKARTAPTRIVVRDAHFTPVSQEQFLGREAAAKPGLEIKTENLVNRRFGSAEHPHTGERVPPGARFAGEILLNVYDDDKQRETRMVQAVRQAMALVQETGAIGAGGSRGSGCVKFVDLKEEPINPKILTL
jgi:CRISPR-associated protein Csm3